MVIIDRGRDIEERSVVYIENGVFKGLGFFDLNYQINNLQVLESIITPMENNRDTQHIIQNYLRRNKNLKIIQISS
jgi:DNA polymerase-3 subunit epsilon